MRKSAVQISLWDTYNGVSEAIEQHKPELIRLLEEHIDYDRLIPVSFKLAFYRYLGRKHQYHLESFIRAFVVQKMLGIGRIIIDKELPVGIVLDSIRDNLCCWIIPWNHASRSVDHGTREGKPIVLP